MKKILVSLFIAISFISCQSSHTESTENATVKSDSTAAYACPMDPDVTGKKGDKCSKCGMDLTEGGK